MDAISRTTIGLLLSGGLDSAALLGRLLEAGRRVQPFYIRTDVAWADAEMRAVARLCQSLAQPRLAPLVTLDLPLADLYAGHWSITGRNAPAAATPDEAVFLPGRNLLLVMKAAVWCQMHGVEELALAPLAANPFPDATREFFARLEETLALSGAKPVRIVTPLARMSKSDVIRLARNYPLELSFSCIAPHEDRHCGVCNKCAERQAAFAAAGLADPTVYAVSSAA